MKSLISWKIRRLVNIYFIIYPLSLIETHDTALTKRGPVIRVQDRRSVLADLQPPLP